MPKAGETLPYVAVHFNIQLGCIHFFRCMKSHNLAHLSTESDETEKQQCGCRT